MRRSSRDVASTRTRILGLTAVFVAALFATLVTLERGPFSDTLAYIGPPLIFTASAAVCVACALQMTTRRPVWLLTGGALLCWATGDLVWAYYHIVLGRDTPYPGFAELLYAGFYVLVAWALLLALSEHRAGSDLLWPSVEAFLSVIGVGVAVWVAIVRPMLDGLDELPASTITDLAYMAADLVLLMIPAVTLLLVASRLPDRVAAIPWAIYSAGVCMLALGDLGWFWQQATTGWQPGSLVDFSWMAGAGIVGVASSMELDYLRVRARAQRPNEGLSLRAR